MIARSRFVIAVPDLAVSSAFYRDILGFKIHAIDDPGWLFYTKDNVCIMAGECPDAIPPNELGDHSFFAYLVVDEIDEYYKALNKKGVKFTKELRLEPWGMIEFGLRTIDGHRIMVGKPE
ncbi:VOC family protein [Kordiimonas aquimaris]|uniref:VOC family protein n=1 Tax=Kordiimonas aquimaris TaxID=707591 RepID=UPI0021D038DE|nr:VOC family protein [Kordiimonas aquimaris]